ncbi:MAG: NUDIX domain-containing protein [Alphaproteobacteria bacterium]|nr:NUDIX domain-containing protein [Alphaproteobacteria bacterium]
MKVGAIAYKKTKKGVKICLVTSRRHTGTLTLPKGHAKQNEVMAKAALRELFEEAGVVGKIIKKSRPILFSSKNDEVDDVLYFFVKIKQTCTFWPEQHIRDRIFLTLDEAIEKRTSKATKKILRLLVKNNSLVRRISQNRSHSAQPVFLHKKKFWKKSFTR